MTTERPAPDDESAPDARRAVSSAGASSANDPLSEDNETLLSAPQPAERFEVETDARLTALETRIAEVGDKLDRLVERPRRTAPRELWWLIFLLVLALAWQLVLNLR